MISDPTKEKINGQRISENIYLCTDGKYRWTYAFNMLKNPVILFTTWRVICMSGFIIWLFMIILQLLHGDMDMDAFIDITRGYVLITLFICFLGIFAYLVIAGQYGWKYMVIFEMDENGITHRQMKSQFDKAKALGYVTAMAGFAAGRLTTAATGINAATRDSLSTDFNAVKKVKASRLRNTIFVNAPFSHNQIYTTNEDFDFVLEYILRRLPPTAKLPTKPYKNFKQG